MHTYCVGEKPIIFVFAVILFSYIIINVNNTFVLKRKGVQKASIKETNHENKMMWRLQCKQYRFR